jgi:Bacterial Ig-like domain
LGGLNVPYLSSERCTESVLPSGYSTTKECTYTVNSAPSKPGTPTLSATSSTPNQGSYTLNWDASSDTDNNLDHYVLQHKNSATGAQFSTVDENVNGASYSFGSDGNQPEDEGTWTYRVRAVDSLGETSEDTNESGAVKVDQSKPNAPLASAGPDDYTDQNGDKWYKDSATVSFAANNDPPLADGSDGSGVKSVSDPVSLNTSGVLDYSGTATDNSGNESDATSGSIKVDAKAPTSSASAKDSANNDYNSGDWTNKDVTVTLSASDDQGSGVKHIAYSVNGNADTAAGSSKQITVSAEGTTTITFHAVDNVGKEEAQEHTFTVKLDKSAPTITDLRATTSPNGAGWYNKDVTNRFKASDSGSGLSTACQTSFPLSAGENIQSKTTSGEGSAVKVTSDSCTDVAGNTATGKDSATFKIDKTAPSVSPTIPQAGATNVSRTTAVKATFSEVVQAATLTSANVQLFSGNSTKPVKAALRWDPLTDPTSVTLTPSTKLDASKTYTAKIKGGATGVKDLADNPLASDFSWTFTTGAR